jgi:hypothetical protein
MLSLPNVNELIRDLDGRLFPLGWAKLLWRLRHPDVRSMRVALMGVVKRLQASRLASQIALMMIETSRHDANQVFSATRGEIGWVLEDNEGMVSIAKAIDSHLNRIYRIYAKDL